MKLNTLPKVRLANLPTPLQELPNLTRALNGPRIFVKRDDLTGLAFGGNKTRKLEYLMGEAVEQKADCIVTHAGFHSNWLTQTAAVAGEAGDENLHGQNRSSGVTAKDTVAVRDKDGNTAELKTRNIVVATGASVAVPPGWEIDGEKIVTYLEAHHAFDAPDQPLRVRSGLAHTARRDGRATIGTNPAARADAIDRVQGILNRHLRESKPAGSGPGNQPQISQHPK